MCVVFVTGKEHRVPDDWCVAGFEANPAGAGIAYRDRGQVRWKKGMNLEEAREMNAKVPLPYVIHFRIPTCGGPIKKLTHPFPIEAKVDLALEGITKGSVLFHNGHWARWKEQVMEAAQRGRIKIPNDKWSDSRALAWMAAHFGIGALELIDEKVCAFGTDSIELFGLWTVKDHIYCSNLGWEFKANTKKWEREKSNWNNNGRESSDKEESQQNHKPTGSSLNLGGIDTRRYLPHVEGNHRAYCQCFSCVSARHGEARKAAMGVMGGTPTETPFDLARRKKLEADAKWAMKPPKISKKKWKKAQREFEIQEKKLKTDRLKQQMKEFARNAEAGALTTH